MRGAAALLFGAVAISGCGQTFEEKQAEALAAEPTMAPGIYSDVRMSGETGDLGGMELSLPQGSASREIEFVLCEGWCNTVERQPLRRGLGGVAFSMRYAERTVDVTVQPAGNDAVTVSADFGGGLEQRRLRRVAREFGLSTARSNEADLPR
jgi:hypothetical protein